LQRSEGVAEVAGVRVLASQAGAVEWAILLLGPALGASYETVSQAAAPWASPAEGQWAEAPSGLLLPARLSGKARCLLFPRQ